MTTPAIVITNLSKVYRIGAAREPYLTLRDTVAGAAARVVRGVARMAAGAAVRRAEQQTLWALRDVSFEVPHGACFGIIGCNGAGKTTLLKILSQITPPTGGRISYRGCIASLLGVGTGFHPELTGRENIFLNGTILGMTRAEVRRNFDAIVAFADIERFLDTPVKRYSSGMYVRLAFAVAAHLQPDILLVDEVLAVGDIAFQKRCLGKIEDVTKQGRTVLFVSHSMAVVSALCSQAVLLDQGRVAALGNADDVVRAYLTTAVTAGGASPACQPILPADHDSACGTGRIAFRSICLANAAYPTFTVHWKEPIAMELEVAVREPIRNAVFSVTVSTPLGVGIVGVRSSDPGERLWSFEPGVYRIIVTLDNALQAGNYALTFGAATAVGNVPLARVADVVGLEVLDVALGDDVAPARGGQLVNGTAFWTEPVRC
jgi:lipopolysaccharide transport system ATP-binding protein